MTMTPTTNNYQKVTLVRDIHLLHDIRPLKTNYYYELRQYIA